MKGLGLVIGVTTTLVTLCSHTPGDAATRARFRAETVLNDVAARISAGGGHSCQVNEDGTVRCWGANNVGQLGNGLLGNGIAANEPTRIPTLVVTSPNTPLTSVVAVAAGGSHTCALLSAVLTAGTVHCWGLNGNGQLGNDALTNRLNPVAVIGLTNAVAIAAGANHTCALLADGTVRCWGANGNGQLGIGSFGGNQLTPVTVMTSPNIPLTNVIAITAGSQYTCALLANSTVRCWGINLFGQLGNNTTAPSSVPVTVMTSPNTSLTNVIAIAAGTFHTCALLVPNGAVRCWGDNRNGQLGNNSTVQSNVPVTVMASPNIPLLNIVALATGNAHTCALLANSNPTCWGSNSNGQLGIGALGGTRLTPVDVVTPSPNNAVAVTAGSSHTCALLANGSAKCWGANQSGQLGISNTAPNNTAPTPVLGGGGSVTARDIAAGRNHTCAVRADGAVRCWGSNGSGQLGDGTTTTRLSPVAVLGLTDPVVAIAAGEAHTCALVASGTVRCWGDNSVGQLGDGTTTNRLTPVTVSGLTVVVGIAAGGTLGSSHTCALLANGTVQCWGANGSGQLGTGNTLPSNRPVAVSGLTNAVSIAVGEFHTCALLANGLPFCWGFNSSGQLGNGTLNSQPVPIIASLDNAVAIAGGNNHTCGLRADGTAWCWGNNLLGQLGIGNTVSQSLPRFVNLFSTVAIAGGFGHSCALLADGTARCWGDNASGQLGNSTVTASLTPVTVGKLVGNLATFFSPLQGAVNITTGRRHSCALLVSGGVVCWGENTVGQLGIGSTTNQFTPVSVPSFTLNIDPSVFLKQNERESDVTILANCEEGRQLHVDVTLAQGLVSGHGIGVGECTGRLERYPVTVSTQGSDGFTEGSGEVSAEALILEGGSVVDTQQWTRQVRILSAPQINQGKAEKLGTASTKITLEGEFNSDKDLGDLSQSAVVMSNVLNEEGRELVAFNSLPIPLSTRGGKANEAIFQTPSGAEPKLRMTVKNQGEGLFTFRLVVEFVDSLIPTRCSGSPRTTTLSTRFTLVGPNAAAEVAPTQPWECLKGDSQLRVEGP
jgi:alpha-tubulin suppressor-like RCC1 family protein